MELEEIANKTIRSVIALMGRSIFLQVISFVAFFLLGIFLSPHALGVYIIVSALMRIFTLFTDLGLGAALIQKHEEPSDLDLSTTFFLQTVLVLVMVFSGYLLTPMITTYAHLTRDAVFLYHVLILTLFISSLKTIPSILLERKLAFDKQIIPQIAESIIFNILVVILAFKGLDVASYSWAILASSLIGLPIYFLVSPWKISLHFSGAVAKSLFSYGVFFQGKSVLAIIKDDLLTFSLSGLVGTSGLGFWGWAQRWSYFPFRFTVDTITKVTFPAYSRVQKDNLALSKGIEKSLLAVSLILFPLLTCMSILINNFIYLVPRYFKWGPSLPSFYFLAAAAGISAVSNILINALDATGRVKTTLTLMIIWIILTWSLTLLLVTKIGFTGIALASLLVSLTIVLTIYLVKRVIPFRFLPNIYQAIIGSLALALTQLTIINLLPNTLLTVGLGALSGAIIYLIVVGVIAKKQLSEDLKILISVFRK